MYRPNRWSHLAQIFRLPTRSARLHIPVRTHVVVTNKTSALAAQRRSSSQTFLLKAESPTAILSTPGSPSDGAKLQGKTRNIRCIAFKRRSITSHSANAQSHQNYAGFAVSCRGYAVRKMSPSPHFVMKPAHFEQAAHSSVKLYSTVWFSYPERFSQRRLPAPLRPIETTSPA